MKTGLGLDFKNISPKLKILQPKVLAHSFFIAVTIVLLCYIYMVMRISSLANAEPAADAASSAQSANIPTIDKKAIGQVQMLEKNNTQVHSLFSNARNNPFSE